MSLYSGSRMIRGVGEPRNKLREGSLRTVFTSGTRARSSDVCESDINTGQIRGQIVANNDTQTQVENTSSG
jgi:hypothetical protein